MPKALGLTKPSIVHATHADAALHGRRLLLLRRLRDHGLGGYHETGDRRSVLQGDPHDLRRIDDAGVQHVDILLGLRVEAEGRRLVLKHLADDDRTLHARVLRDLADWGLKRPEHDVDAGLDVRILVAELADRGLGPQQRDAAAGHDAFLDRSLGRMHRVVDAVLLLLDLDLGRTADADDRDAARQLGETLLQLFLVVVGGRVLDLCLDLRNPPLDLLLLAGAIDDCGVFLLTAHTLGRAEHLKGHVLELDAKVSAIMAPAVRTAMSSSIALRRSQNPRAFTAAAFRPPRNLLTTSVAKASPSMSSATMSRGLRSS